MTAASQYSLAQPAELSGVGVHSGRQVTLTLRPAPADHGLVFRRTDLPDAPRIPVCPESIVWDRLANRTTLGSGEARVQTTEHVLSGLVGMGIDNALIDVTGDEVPGLDNSALPFVEAIERAGVADLGVDRRPATLESPITVRDESTGAEITAMPSEHFEVTYFAEFPADCFLGTQTINLPITADAYRREIAPARTWIFAHLIPDLLERGLGQGGTAETVLVIDKERYATEPRFDDEPACHKALDLIGDLALLGRPLHAHVLARRSGHALNAQLVRRLADVAR